MAMAATIVVTHDHGLYYCGHSWLWPLLLWLLMIMASNIVDTHGHGRFYCGYLWS